MTSPGLAPGCMPDVDLEACANSRRGVGDNDAKSAFVVQEGNTDDQGRPCLAEVAQVNHPDLTALDVWEGHGGRLVPRLRRRVGPKPRLAHRHSRLPTAGSRLQTGDARLAEAPAHSLSVRPRSSRVIMRPNGFGFKLRLARTATRTTLLVFIGGRGGNEHAIPFRPAPMKNKKGR